MIAKAAIDAKRAALYLRVSTEEQAERGTIETQREALRSFALDRYAVIRVYADDGVSGAYPLDQRPAGRQLLDDARAGYFDTVLVYRLDRLGRSLPVILNSQAELDRLGVSLRSVSEDFQTETAAGRAQFQMIGVFAELERGTIRDRMTMGRDRAVRLGKWTGGPVPFGYDLDEDGLLLPSERFVLGAGMSEAEIARSVFENIAAGSSTVAECRRLNAIGVPTARRYGGGREVTIGDLWLPSRVNNMIKNTVYRGVHTFRAKSGPIEREVSALVEATTWQRANMQLGKNRALAKRNAKHDYLLRGLIRCAACGVGFVGSGAKDRRTGWVARYYRCGSQLGALKPDVVDRCKSKNLAAHWMEDQIWSDIRGFLLDPGAALADAQAQAEARQVDTERMERERTALAQRIAEKAAERERVTTLARRGVIDIDEATTQLDAIKQEGDSLRFRLADLDAQLIDAAGSESKYALAEEMLLRLGDQLAEIEATDDHARKRRLVELLVLGIEVVTAGAGAKKEATIRIRYAFGPNYAVAISTDSYGHTRHTGSKTSRTASPTPC